MAKGHKIAGRPRGATNLATREVRALASAYGPAAIRELAKLAGIAHPDENDAEKPHRATMGEALGELPAGAAESEQARISAINTLLDRGYGRSPLSTPIEIALPNTSTPEGVIEAMACIVRAVAKGEVSPAQAKDLADVIEAQRRAIELGDHEQRLRAIEARAGIESAHAPH